jgi:hypothetical protein
MESGEMNLRVLRTWQPGETVSLTEDQIRQLEIGGQYDSYHQTYEFENASWKVVTRVARRDGQAEYLLECIQG